MIFRGTWKIHSRFVNPGGEAYRNGSGNLHFPYGVQQEEKLKYKEIPSYSKQPTHMLNVLISSTCKIVCLPDPGHRDQYKQLCMFCITLERGLQQKVV